MGVGTLTDRSNGETILDTFFNSIHDALNGDLVGRDTSTGAATSGQNLGTNAIPFGTAYFNSLVLNGSAVDTSQLTAPKNRIVSGATRSASNQPQFIDPNGAAASFILEGATTNLVLDIDSTTVTVSTDITVSSLTVGPSTTATCLVDDTDAADQDSTRTWGEYEAEKETITVDNMGAEFQAFIGQWVIVEITGVATEYALVYVKSTTELTNAYRGWFTNSSSAPVNRTAFFDNDTITVLSTGWVFVENNGTTVDVSYTTPVWSHDAPGAPATGDYWYDMANQTWKRYDGASFQIINRTIVGVVGIDSSNCVCARSFDFYQNFDEYNSIELNVNSTEIVEVKNQNAKVSVLGVEHYFGYNLESWNITTDLAPTADLYDATEQASTYYYLYLEDTGETIISDIEPHYRPDLKGRYHPHLPARWVGTAYNDGSSDIVGASGEKQLNSVVELQEGNGFGSTDTAIRRFNTTVIDEGTDILYADTAANGATFTVQRSGRYYVSCSHNFSSASVVGFSKNSASLTTDVSSIGYSERETMTSTSGTNNVGAFSKIMKLNKGDVMRVHGNPSTADGANPIHFIFRRTA